MSLVMQCINLAKFEPLMQAVSGYDCCILLFDKEGNLYQDEYFESRSNTEEFLSLLYAAPISWDDLSRESHFISLQHLATVILVKIKLGADQQAFWLSAFINLPEFKLDDVYKQHLVNVLNFISENIADNYILNLTLRGMAEELAVRYEELNLLYGIDDHHVYSSSTNEYDALNQLLYNCVDYLNVGLIALYVVDQNNFIHHFGASKDKIDFDLLLYNLTGPLLRWMKANRETLVINRDADTDWTDADLKIPFKIVATPLLKANGHLAGILTLTNSINSRDFSNSDRKLTEVLAAEGAKVIRARRDALTDLLNRNGLYEKIEPIIGQVKTSAKDCSLLYVDIDQFKIINDVSGQEAGDKLLIQFSGFIKRQLENKDIIARLGADEFIILLDDTPLEKAQQKAESIRLSISQFRFIYESKIYDVNVSIGVVWLSPETENLSQVLSAADLACGLAKQKGGNRVHVFHNSDQELMIHERQMRWISRINRALEDQRFVLYRQKIQSLADAENEIHYEILIRLKDEEGNIIPPNEFIPAAERYNLMTKLDRWIIRSALDKMAEFYASVQHTKLSCSINLSGQSLCEIGFLEYLVDEVKRSRLPPETICFEITETVAVSNLTQAVEFMQAVKQIGCKFSLDDFGSGMSSFTYLKNLPVDYLKIDGYFIKTMLENKIDYAMVESINQIGQVMGLKTIAEFVENDAIISELKKIGVNYAQGYGISKPEPF